MDRFEPRVGHGREAGFSLLEAVTALAVFGLALLIAANALTAQAALSRRLEVRAELLRTDEVVLESLRGGMMPLVSGRVRPPAELRQDDGFELYTMVEVEPRPEPGLLAISVRSWTELEGRREEVTLATMVWRP